MKKWFLLFYTLPFICAGSLFAEELGEGFLAVNVSLDWQRYDSEGKTHDFFKLPVSFSAASANYEIITNISIFPELLHIDQYYTGKSRLQPGALEPFSFANFEVQYLWFDWGIVHLNGGFKIGHYGYLTGDWVSPVFTVFLAFKGSLYAFIGDHFMIQIPLEIPLGIINNNIAEYFTFFTGMELTFDPIGPIHNPVGTTVLYSLGLEYNYLHLLTQDNILRNMDYYNTYFKVSVLY
jgi:hypothetical protein